MENPKTKIIYETEIDSAYDLEGNVVQRGIIEEKIRVHVKKFGSLEAFRKRLNDEAQVERIVINEKLHKWFTLSKQVEFMDKVLSGEISDHFLQGSSAPERKVEHGSE